MLRSYQAQDRLIGAWREGEELPIKFVETKIAMLSLLWALKKSLPEVVPPFSGKTGYELAARGYTYLICKDYQEHRKP